MSRSRWTLVVLPVLLGYAAVLAAQTLPSSDVLNQAMKQAQTRASRDMDEAARRAQGTGTPADFAKPKIPDLRSITPLGSRGVDPGQIARRFESAAEAPAGEGAPELLVFASLSMPEESLRRLGQQAQRAGAVIVFRGLKYGIQRGGWTASMAALKPLVETGATLQIQPTLFTRYHVSAVPTFLIDAAPKAGCQTDACASEAVSVVGDVSLDYALERLAQAHGAAGDLASRYLDRYRSHESP